MKNKDNYPKIGIAVFDPENVTVVSTNELGYLNVCLCDCDGSCGGSIDSSGIPLCNGGHNKVSLKRLIEMDVNCVLHIIEEKTGDIVPLKQDEKQTKRN